MSLTLRRSHAAGGRRGTEPLALGVGRGSGCTWLGLLAALAACNAPAPSRPPAGDSGPLAGGAPCAADDECSSGYCVLAAGERRCARTCAGECPAGFVCKRAEGREPSSPSICVPPESHLCDACERDSECARYGALCLTIDGARHCAVDCTEAASCPQGFTCTGVRDGAGQELSRQCLPDLGTCTCNDLTAGARRPCARSTAGVGTCLGEESCVPGLGWAYCDARTPLPESCDRQDNDCDGATDEDESGDALSRPCGYGPEPRRWECRGDEPCANGVYADCSLPPPPGEELDCDGLDDDCDGAPDDGLLGTPNHCAACGDVCPPGPALDGSTVRPCVLGELGAFCGAIACRVPYFDVDGDVTNGCETADDHRRIGESFVLNDTWGEAFAFADLACDDGTMVSACDLRLPSDARAHVPSMPPERNVDFWRVVTEDRADCDPDSWLCARFLGATSGTIELCASAAVADTAIAPSFGSCVVVDLSAASGAALPLPGAGVIYVRATSTSGLFAGTYDLAVYDSPLGSAACPLGLSADPCAL